MVINMTVKPLYKARRPARELPAAPDHLEEPESHLWRGIVEAYDFRDAAELSLLQTALEAHQRMRRCREAIDRDGELVRDRFDAWKPHGLLPHERDARGQFLASMRIL